MPVRLASPTTCTSWSMLDPYPALGVAQDATDAAIRAAYLALARQFTPELHPERFAAIRAAYEAVRDIDKRARYRLFEQGKDETIDAILEEAACRTQRQ